MGSTDDEAFKIAAAQRLEDMIREFRVAFPFAAEVIQDSGEIESDPDLRETLFRVIREADNGCLQMICGWFVITVSAKTLHDLIVWLEDPRD